MTMRRVAIWAVVVMALAAPIFGAAATLEVGSESLAAGTDGVAPCDVNGFAETYTTAGGNVQSVVISGIADPACEGGRLSVTVTGAGNASLTRGQIVIPADGDTTDNTVTVALSPNPFAGNVAGLHVSIVGP